MRIINVTEGRKLNGIVIFGSMGSGKDTLADMLKELDVKVQKYNLSALVRSVSPYLSVEVEWKGNERTFYQEYVDKLREIDIDILNKYTLGLIYNKLKSDLGIKHDVVDKESFNSALLKDLPLIKQIEMPLIVGGRTLADFNYWKSKNFLMTGIEIDDSVRFHRLALRDGETTARNSSNTHNTERDVHYIVENLCDVVIDNNGTFEDLKSQAAKLLKLLE